MTISAAFVLFAVIWFLLLFIILPLRIKTQNDLGNTIEGTPASAPTNPRVKIKMFWTTVLTTIIWIPLCLIIMFEIISISDLNFYNRLRE